jgi:hypothetical protein
MRRCVNKPTTPGAPVSSAEDGCARVLAKVMEINAALGATREQPHLVEDDGDPEGRRARRFRPDPFYP